METAVIVLSCVCFILGCTLYLVIGRLEWYKEAFFETSMKLREERRGKDRHNTLDHRDD